MAVLLPEPESPVTTTRRSSFIRFWGPVQCSGAARPARFRCPQTPSAKTSASALGLPPHRTGGGDACLLVALDVADDVLDGADLLRLLVRDLHVVLLLERHHQLHDVERVRAEILDEGGLRRDFLLAHAELLADDLLHLLLHAGSHYSSLNSRARPGA